MVALDQLTKFAVTALAPDWLVLNRAVAFSVPMPWWVIVAALSLLVGLVVYEWQRWTRSQRGRQAWILGLLLGGACSNLIDRLAVGGVRDFINVKVWPVFNLADIALTIGVVMLFWYALRSSQLRTSHGEPQGATRATTRQSPK
ncbi:MAG: signal peptidase II [Parcubacteria group bacterium]